MTFRNLLRRGYGLLSATPSPAPAPAAREVPEHAVHFYAEDEALLTRLEQYVIDGARLGQTAVVIATPAHRQALRDRLACWDLADAFLGLDAAQMLSRFMVDGMPDEDLFDATVGALLRTRLGDDGGASGIRAYGEMVALLWADDNVAGTYALEELWNALQQEVAFPLLCAYPVPEDGADLGEGLAEVCRLHTHVHRLAA
ncbi:MAG: MEDS domain-containing protein [Mycobacteriales bacterium]